MGMSALRGMVTGVLLVLLPFSTFAADSDAAMLYTSGHAWVNGSHVPRSSSAIFSGDLLQTHSDSIANINQPGSGVQVRSDSAMARKPPLSLRYRRRRATSRLIPLPQAILRQEP